MDGTSRSGLIDEGRTTSWMNRHMPKRSVPSTEPGIPSSEAALLAIGAAGYTVRPPSGTRTWPTVWHAAHDAQAVADLADRFDLRQPVESGYPHLTSSADVLPTF